MQVVASPTNNKQIKKQLKKHQAYGFFYFTTMRNVHFYKFELDKMNKYTVAVFVLLGGVSLF